MNTNNIKFDPSMSKEEFDNLLSSFVDDSEIQEIVKKYKKGLNPFANKKRYQMMREEIGILLNAREEEKRKEEERVRREKRDEERRLQSELRKQRNEKIVKSTTNFVEKNKTAIGIVFALVLAIIGGMIFFDKYKSTVQTMSFTFADEEKYVGDLLDISFTAEPSTSVYEDDDVQIILSDPSLLNTDGNVISCAREGTLIAKLLYKDKEMDSKTITIKPVLINKLYLPDFQIGRGNSITLEPVIEPSNATNRSFIASVDDTDIAAVNDNVVTGVEVGQTTLHLKSVDGFSYDVKVEVIEIEPVEIKWETSVGSLIVGETAHLAVKYVPDNSTLRNITFSSTNNNIVSVDQNGNVVANYPGQATISAKYSDDIYCEETISVSYPPADSITLSSNYDSLYVGDQTYVRYSLSPSNNSNEKVTYKSSDENVLTVNEKGLVTAVAVGKATITAFADSKSVKDSVTFSVSEKQVTRSVSSGSSNSSRGDVSNDSGQSSSSGTMVWIPNSGKKYHRNSSCSNMKNPTQVTLEYAQSHGYTACKKCY